MQKGHELLIPTAHAHLEFLALMKIILFTKKGNSTIVFSFYFFTFVLRYDKGWMIYCQNHQLPKKRKNKNKNKEKIDKKKEKKIETKNASLKLDRLRHYKWEKKPSFNNVISKRHIPIGERRNQPSPLIVSDVPGVVFCGVVWIFFEERKLQFVLTQHSWKSAIMRQW